MAIVNGSFEDQAAGSGPGVADGWAVVASYTAEEYAEFTHDAASSVADSKETFEGEWPALFTTGLIGAFSGYLLDIEPAFFSSAAQSAETFGIEWGTLPVMGPFDYSTLPLDYADFDSLGTAQDYEDFEEWPLATDALKPAFVPADLEFGTFDSSTPESVEDFEEEWRSNEDYISAFVGFGTDIGQAYFATNYTVLSAVETFEGERFDLTGLAFDPTTDTWTKVGHGLQNVWVVTLINSGGRLPNGYLTETEYFVQNEAANTFQLAAVNGGAIIDGTDVGFGSHRLKHDTDWWWTEELIGV